jgi:hypothetical protein
LCGDAIGSDNRCVYCGEEGKMDFGASYCPVCGGFAKVCMCELEKIL